MGSVAAVVKGVERVEGGLAERRVLAGSSQIAEPAIAVTDVQVQRGIEPGYGDCQAHVLCTGVADEVGRGQCLEVPGQL